MDGRDETWPVMLAGVFNVFPLGPVYQWIVGQDNFGECFRLMSAYQFYQSGQEPAFTCYNHLLKNTVDYIFFSSSRRLRFFVSWCCTVISRFPARADLADYARVSGSSVDGVTQ
mmetsp:Transcript_23704/g.53733  ORF Transcript_23704/g.53733 Transcript_23704/m.53733 type:complete len:114 (+) Transcript_23704:937-1278(+)